MTPRQIATLCCSLTGLVLAAPGTWLDLTHRRSAGKLCEVFVVPLDDGRSRLSVAYDFKGEGVSWIGWAQDDGWMRSGPDPVLTRAEAESRAAKLREELQREGHHRAYQVHYQANDPAGTAFISLRESPLWIGLQLGIICVAVSLILSLPIPLPFMKATR